jgi:hypothetical protein
MPKEKEVKFLISMLALALVSCSSNIYLKNDQGNTFKQCVTPDIYTVSPNLPDEYYEAVISGFDYWNNILDNRHFVRVGDYTSASTIGIITVRTGYFDPHSAPLGNDYCIQNNMKFLKKGCIIGADIIIKDKCLKESPEVVETLIRHSVGNILGLANQIAPGTLMDTRIQLEAQHPIDANDEEIEAVRQLYNN